MKVDINPKFTVINDEIEFKLKPEKVVSSFICEIKLVLDVVYLKKEILLFRESISNVDKSNEYIVKLNDLKFDTIEHNDLLNISVLEVKLTNLPENLNETKKFIVQFLKEKNILYKNIIEK